MTKAAAQINAALELHRAGRHSEAAALADVVAAQNPEDFRLLALAGVILTPFAPARAINVLVRSLELAPDQPDVQCNLGLVLSDYGDPVRAEFHLGQAVELMPNLAEAHYGLVSLHLACGRPQAAMDAVDRLLAIAPEHSHGLWARAQLLLMMGRFEEGWEAFECRWTTPGLPVARVTGPAPEWDGSCPRGKTIFLYAEQGLGDALQFARYIPLVAAQGARIVLGAPKPVAGLLGRIAGVSEVVVAGEGVRRHDGHLALMSLPRVFGTTLGTIPAAVPYLSPIPALGEAWKERVGGCGGLKVGLAWLGSSGHVFDRYRSIHDCEALHPLASLPHVTFFNLAPKAVGFAEMFPAGQDCGADSLEDIAALIQSLDLVVTVDTVFAHLAGALGRPVWLMLSSAVSDWRWLTERSDSPWYPTMRIYRQETPGDWAGVVARVAADIAAVTQP